MKSVMRKIQNTGENRIDFVSNAVAKEVKRLDDELNGQYYQIMRKEYYENEASYFTKGIKSFEDYLHDMATNTKDIKRLEDKLEGFIKVEEEHKEQDKWFVQYKKDNPDIEEKLDSLEKNMEKKARSIFKKEMDWLDKEIKRLKKIEAETLRKRSKISN